MTLYLTVKCGTNVDSDTSFEALESLSVRIAGPTSPDSDPVGTWPWMASAGTYSQDGRTWQHQCGGAILSERSLKYVLPKKLDLV